MNDKLKKTVKRCNDVFFNYSEWGKFVADGTLTLDERIKRTPPFIITSFPYSGIGEGVRATIDPSSDMVSIPSISSPCSTYPSWNNLLAKYWPIHGTLKFLSATFRLGIFKVANIGPFLFSRILPIILSGYGKISFANIGPVLFSRILPII